MRVFIKKPYSLIFLINYSYHVPKIPKIQKLTNTRRSYFWTCSKNSKIPKIENRVKRLSRYFPTASLLYLDR